MKDNLTQVFKGIAPHEVINNWDLVNIGGLKLIWDRYLANIIPTNYTATTISISPSIPPWVTPTTPPVVHYCKYNMRNSLRSMDADFEN